MRLTGDFLKSNFSFSRGLLSPVVEKVVFESYPLRVLIALIRIPCGIIWQSKMGGAPTWVVLGLLLSSLSNSDFDKPNQLASCFSGKTL